VKLPGVLTHAICHAVAVNLPFKASTSRSGLATPLTA
jgi:hypothetical protein